MLRSATHLAGFTLGATDGSIGKVKDLYFDDEAWVVRYVVVNTGSWLGGHEVLISPYSIGEPDRNGNVLPVSLTKEQVKSSPGIDTDKPVSRRYENTFLGYYGYPYYWGDTGLWGEGAYPGGTLKEICAADYPGYTGDLRSRSDDTTSQKLHLRSCEAVKGYHVHANDGEIGHVDGFIVDDSTWSIRYLIVNTSNWWVGHQVIISPEWLDTVDWLESSIIIHFDRQAIKQAPTYRSDMALERNDDVGLYKHRGRKAHWLNHRQRSGA